MTADFLLRAVHVMVFVGVVCAMTVYHRRFNWAHTIAGRILMCVGAALGMSGLLSTIADVCPSGPYRTTLLAVAWIFVLGVVLTWTVTVSIIKKPPPKDPGA